MNILYFGDARDTFKFELLKKLYDSLSLNQILYIPMLTSNYISNEGKKKTLQMILLDNCLTIRKNI